MRVPDRLKEPADWLLVLLTSPGSCGGCRCRKYWEHIATSAKRGRDRATLLAIAIRYDALPIEEGLPTLDKLHTEEEVAAEAGLVESVGDWTRERMLQTGVIEELRVTSRLCEFARLAEAYLSEADDLFGRSAGGILLYSVRQLFQGSVALTRPRKIDSAHRSVGRIFRNNPDLFIRFWVMISDHRRRVEDVASWIMSERCSQLEREAMLVTAMVVCTQKHSHAAVRVPVFFAVDGDPPEGDVPPGRPN